MQEKISEQKIYIEIDLFLLIYIIAIGNQIVNIPLFYYGEFQIAA